MYHHNENGSWEKWEQISYQSQSCTVDKCCCDGWFVSRCQNLSLTKHLTKVLQVRSHETFENDQDGGRTGGGFATPETKDESICLLPPVFTVVVNVILLFVVRIVVDGRVYGSLYWSVYRAVHPSIVQWAFGWFPFETSRSSQLCRTNLRWSCIVRR